MVTEPEDIATATTAPNTPGPDSLIADEEIDTLVIAGKRQRFEDGEAPEDLRTNKRLCAEEDRDA